MGKIKLPKFAKAVPLMMAAAVSHCSNKADDGPGTCSLHCGESIIGSNSYEAKGPESVDLQCVDAGAELDIGFNFLITRPADASRGRLNPVPVPHVSIRPTTFGTMGHDDDKYPTIITPEADFCSDSCGMVTIRFRPLCPPAGKENPISVQIVSGAMISEISTLRLSNTEEAAEEDTDDSGGLLPEN